MKVKKTGNKVTVTVDSDVAGKCKVSIADVLNKMRERGYSVKEWDLVSQPKHGIVANYGDFVRSGTYEFEKKKTKSPKKTIRKRKPTIKSLITGPATRKQMTKSSIH